MVTRRNAYRSLFVALLLGLCSQAAQRSSLIWDHLIHAPDATTEGGRIISGDAVGNVFVAG
jgi:hypothetical protein